MLENERKNQYLWRVGMFLIYSIIAGAIMSVLFLIGYEEHSIESDNNHKIIFYLCDNNEQGGDVEMTDKNEQDHPETNNTEKEPEPPKSRTINENFERITEKEK